MDRDKALISVRADGYVDGASFSGDIDFYNEAERNGFELRKVPSGYAKEVIYTHISVNNTLLA